jgi:bacillolysin
MLFSLKGLYAQTDSLFWNSEMKRIATPTSKPGWINIRPEININPSVFFSAEKKALQLGVNDDMQLSKTEKDNIGFTHYKYQQFYKGYKIIFAEFLLHSLNGKLITANGKIITRLNRKPVINISKTLALQKALQFLPAAQYAWQIPQLENDYKEILHDPVATYKPVAELVWIGIDEKGDNKNSPEYELAYMFDIYPASLYGKKIFISAANGRVIKSYPLRANCDGAGAFTNFYGFQGFSTRLIPGSSPARWNLWNDCQPAFIHTKKWNATGPTYTDYVSSAGNNWSSFSSEATSHWCMERTYNYYLSIFGRNGWNNANGGVFILQDALFPCATPPPPGPCPSGQNASFGGGTMLVGNADNANTIDDFNSLDIIAHEFTHGVTQSSFANLIYSKESGALNESFSDILGVSCHAWLFGLSANTWKVGFDRKNPNNVSQSLYLRNMSNPNDATALTPSPDTYLTDPLWVSTTSASPGNDNWGVHTNSGVQNFMYYLLVSGGSGTNKSGTAYSLVGIGISAAREIAYRALTFYLFPTSGYADAREAWVQAAVNLYGECSFQAIETGKAWNAVGLPPPSNNIFSPYCGTYGGAVFSVTDPNIYSLAPSCFMTVLPASLVQFGANKVIMNPGFKAQNGSHFRAYVSDCRFAAH